ncbi:hypothetical protein [Chryseobacterium sp. T1]
MINRFLLTFSLIFCLGIFLAKSQSLDVKVDSNLKAQLSKLDQLMQYNDPNIVEILDSEVSFGHSNGWIQNFNDFKKDIIDKKVNYQSIKQTEIKEYKKYKNLASVRRLVHVKGLYKTFDFEMNLSLLEIWIKKKGIWKLWSRQSIELK